MNYDNYIGLKYKEKGRVAPNVDCYGLTRLFYKQELNIDLPSFDAEYEASEEERIADLIAQFKEGWEKVEVPTLGDIVLFRVMGIETHMGVMVSSDSFIHVRENMDSVREDISTHRWNKRLVGFFRYVENKSCKELPSASLSGIPHPLRTQRYTVPIPVGSTVSQIVAGINKEYKVSEEYKSTFVVMINGVPVPEHLWEKTVVQQGDAVEYRCVPGKGAVKIIFAIALIAFAPYLATSLLGTTFGAFAATALGGVPTFLAVAKTAVTLTGLALLRSAQKPPTQAQAADPGVSERQLMISGAANRANPYGAIPVVLGKVRMTPVIGAQNYLTYENDRDSYLSMLLVWGFGPLEISPAYKFGEVPISNYSDYEIVTLDRKTEPTSTVLGNFNRIYGKDVDAKAVQQTLVCDGNPQLVVPPGPWFETSTNQTSDSVTLSFHYPEGLRFVYSNGSKAGQSGGYNVVIQVQKSADGITWLALDQFDSSAFVTRQVTTYTQQTVPCITDSGLCTTTVPVVSSITEPVAKKDAFTITKTYNSSSPNDIKFIRVRRLTGDNTEDDDRYRFYFSVVLQSANFVSNSNPAIDPPNCKIAKTAIKIKATDQLNSNIEGFNSVVQTIAPTWNGSSWVDAATSNPASLFIYVLTHPANPRRKALSQINLTELADFYNYCQTRGFEYNSIVAQQRGLMDVLTEICLAGRASPLQKDGKFTVVIDREKPISQHFTPHNSWGFEAVKALPEIPHGLRVQYLDQDANFQESEIIVYNTGYNQNNASLFESMQFPGTTKKSLIIDRARWEFAQGKLRPETYSLNTDIEYLICNKGDRVKVMSDVPLWGLGSGRIKNHISTTQLELDEVVPMEVGKTYTIRVRNSVGASNTVNLVTPSVSGNYSTINLASPLSLTNSSPNDLFMFGELGKEAQDLVVLGIEPTENMNARLILLDYGVTDTYNIFTQYTDQTANFVFETQITLPPSIRTDSFGTKKPLITNIVSDESVMEIISKGVFQYNMAVAYVNASELPNTVSHVEVQYDISASTDSVNTKNESAIYSAGVVNVKNVLEGENYKIRARYVSKLGTTGLWSDYTTHIITGKRSQPGKVVGFTAAAEKSLGKVRLAWTANLEPDLRGYEVRSDSNFGSETNRIFFGEEKSCFANPPLSQGSTLTYYICAIDYAGNYSREIVATTFTYLAINEVTNVAHTFADDSLTNASITLSWSDSASQFATEYIRISYDSVVKDVKSNTITLPADWLGNRTYTLRTVDILGNQSTGTVVNITKLPPNPVLNYRSQVIDNTVMLYWTLPTRTSLPVNSVLFKKGAAWATAALIGEKKGEFTTVLELQSGEFTYWAATIDTDGNESTPISLTTQVSQPPDFEFFGEFISSFAGVKSNALFDVDGVVMPVNLTETWGQHFTTPSWNSPQDQIQAGKPIYIQPALNTGYYEEIFDYGTILASSRITLNYNGINVSGVPAVNSTISISANGSTYTDYQGVSNVFATNFRYVKVRITATSAVDTSVYKLNFLEVRLDAKKKYDSFTISALATDTLGTIANFGTEFIDVQSITPGIQGTTPLTVVYDFTDSVLPATYSVSSNVCTVSRNAHGFITGQKVKLAIATGSGLSEVYTITSATTNAFTVAMVTPNTSGNCSLYAQSCRVYVFNAAGARVNTSVSLSLTGY